jgi:NhaA family Na+:H+ antiporter
MATDIAFTLGVLALLGSRVALPLKIFVTALAIVDDIIAVLVIAVFYAAHIHLLSLAAGLTLVALSFGVNLLGVRNPAVYALLGISLWFAMLKSGVHAKAGVLLAFTIPARTYLNREHFLGRCRKLLDKFESARANSYEANAALHALEAQFELVESPLHRIEHALRPWVSFLVMPLFAFAVGAGLCGSIIFLSHGKAQPPLTAPPELPMPPQIAHAPALSEHRTFEQHP